MTLTKETTAIDSVRRGIERLRANLEAVSPSSAIEYPQHVISNMDLLLDTLRVFYGRPEATYLPAFVTGFIERSLGAIDRNLEAIQVSADDPAPIAPELAQPLLRKMDRLYGFCLQSGVVTFGFDAKIAQTQIAAIRQHGTDSKIIFDDVSKEMNNAVANLQEKSATALQTRVEEDKKYTALLQQNLESAGSQLQTIEANAGVASSAASDSKARFSEIQQITADANAAKAQLNKDVSEAATHRQKIVDASDEALRKSQATETQITELSANAKARLNEIADAKATINVQLENITKFYGEIERHRQDMVEVKKEATTTATNLKEETDSRLVDFSARTDAIIKANEQLVSQIHDHLRKAVGVTLFTAFDKRRGHIFWGTVVWAALLVLGTAGAVTFAFWFVHALTVLKVEPAIVLARLIIAAPIAFIITFAAKQYSRERRAEEEYAFKSAISVSLDSYRELLDRIRKENPGADTDFIRQLVLEIFDNPAKRLYAKSEKEESCEDDTSNAIEAVNKLVTTVDSLLSKIPGAK